MSEKAADTNARFNRPPRSLESFGVVGLLGDSCKIYYDSIFSARHIGRVSDLLVAQLKNLAPLQDELRFRIVLMFSFYEAYRCQLLALKAQAGETLPEPLVVECGIDDEKLAVGISFSLPADLALDVATLSRKISAGQAENRVESLIARMCADSDQVIVRVEERTRRIEVVSLLALSAKAGLASASPSPVEVIALRPDVRISPLKAQYVELGDLDYAKLLSEDAPSLNHRPATGELLASSSERDAASSTQVEGADARKEKLTRISGVTQHLGDEDTEIAFVEDEAGSGGSEGATAELETSKKRVRLYHDRIAQLQIKIENLEDQQRNEPVAVGSPEPLPAEATEAGKKTFKDILQNLWPFSRGKKPEDPAASAPMQDSPAQQRQSPPEAGSADGVDPATERLLRDQVEKLESTIERIQKESDALKKEIGNGRAKKWVEGMVGDLLSEKARLNELSKKLNVTLRQKEFEFRNREVALQEENRRKDEQLRQKTYALERAKEQLAQASSAHEKGRAGHVTASEETQYRQKLVFTQKLLAAAKEEGLTLSRRLEEVRNQLAVAQSASKTKLHKDLDYDSMRSKYERLLRQSEEFKRANHQLMEKLGEHEKQKAGGDPADLKRKLEAAMRLAATHQTDSELLRAKVEEMQKTEARLKAEIARMGSALRALKAAQNGGGSGGAGGGSEAA